MARDGYMGVFWFWSWGRGRGFNSLTVVVKSKSLTVPMGDTCTSDGKPIVGE